MGVSVFISLSSLRFIFSFFFFNSQFIFYSDTMRLKRLLLCLAVEASEKSTSEEIKGRGFGISDDHVHTDHATYNLQTCLEMGGVWNNMAVNPYCALPITTTTVAPTQANPSHTPHSSLEQAKNDCL